MADHGKVVINLIQDIATPHNNVLIAHMKERKDVSLRLWYALGHDCSRYRWAVDISQQHLPATIFGSKLNLGFLLHCARSHKEKFVIVGWANINTRFLHFLFFVLRRPFNHWTDYPNPISVNNKPGRRFLRWLSYRMLRFSKCQVFAVGRTTIDYFRALGIPDTRLVNLPIFVEVDENPMNMNRDRARVRQSFGVLDHEFLVMAGSRLIYEKGFDLLIDGVSHIKPEFLEKVRVVIVGSGDQAEALQHRIKELRLSHHVTLQGWLSIEEFRSLIACSDVFVHPARFDSYGGTTLGMAVGVPVIGSTGAGAAVDRIEHGVNGFLYEPEDVTKLATLIANLVNDPILKEKMGKAARATALLWHPAVGANILVTKSI